MSVRVVFQGVRGAHSEAAVVELFGGKTGSFVATGLDTFEQCFEAVSGGKADYAMLPMENNLGGSVADNYDLQLRFKLHAVAEHNKRVSHCLMALPGTKKADVKVVASHYQALAQCAQYVKREMPQATPKQEYDTAGTAEKIRKEKLEGWAALAASIAAKYYDLEILEEDVQDSKNNITRFLLFARTPAVSSLAYPLAFKASVVFATGDRAGALYHAIAPLASAHINMTKLESRPDRRPATSRADVTRDAGALALVYGANFLEDLPQWEDGGGDAADPTSATSSSTATTSSSDLTSLRVGTPANDQDTTQFRATFFMDLRLSDGADEAIRELANRTPFFRVLGVYAAGGPLMGHVAQAFGVPEGTNFPQVQTSAPISATTTTTTTTGDSPTKRARGDAAATATAAAATHHAPLTRAPSILLHRSLTICIVGFGNFGQFLSKTFAAHGHKMVAWSRSDHAAKAAELNVRVFKDLPDALKPADVVLIATSILSFSDVVKQLKPELVKGKLLVDVLSVKTHAKKVLLDAFPSPGAGDDVDLLCTHPMFGPESGKYSWRGLAFVYEKVRVGKADPERCDAFVQVFRTAGCKMVEMTCEEHDEKSANSQFVTHFTGRSLNELGLTTTGIDTRGFASLLALVENTCKDSDDLFLALYKHNPNARKTLDSLRRAVDGVAFRLRSSTSTAVDEQLLRLSEAVDRVAPSKTVKTHALAMELKAKGADLVTTLTVGEPNFGPPEEAVKAAEACLRSPTGTKYTAVGGTMELKKAIVEDYASRKGVRWDPATEVLVSGGGKQSIYQMIHATCGPGDEVVIPSPYWVSYPDIARLAGATPVFIKRTAESGFKLQPAQLRAALTERSRVFILCNPCNPTGCMYTRAELEALADVLRDFPKVLVLADEIYERIVYAEAGEHVSFAALPGMKPRTLMVNGVAKGFAMTGMRIGWMCGPSAVVKAAEKLQGQISSCACSVSQAAAAAALPLHPTVAGPGPTNLANLDRNRRLAYDLLKAVPGVATVMGGGAFYYFVRVQRDASTPDLTGEKLCEYLIRRSAGGGVAFVPGEAFGDAPEDCSFRISYAASEKDVRDGCQRFADGLAELRSASKSKPA